jgi:N-acetylglutamate synthase-like GNAT family acetyltransferase
MTTTPPKIELQHQGEFDAIHINGSIFAAKNKELYRINDTLSLIDTLDEPIRFIRSLLQNDLFVITESHIYRMTDGFVVYSQSHPTITCVAVEKWICVGDEMGRINCYNKYLELLWKSNLETSLVTSVIIGNLADSQGIKTRYVIATSLTTLYFINFGIVEFQLPLKNQVDSMVVWNDCLYVTMGSKIYQLINQQWNQVLDFGVGLMLFRDGMLISGRFCGLKYLSPHGLEEIILDQWVKEMDHQADTVYLRTDTALLQLKL